jgi:hypothetical protein
VVDTFTGRLVVRMPYDAVRGYFIEALLVISIIVITRLSFVRNVTYKIAVPPTASPSSSGATVLPVVGAGGVSAAAPKNS